MVCCPRPKVEIVNEAVPLLSGICARAFGPSLNVTMPVGVGGPPATVAVKVTVWPGVEGLGDEVSIVLEAKAWTFWTIVTLPAGKVPSPL